MFYALLLRKRVELGVSPFPTGPASDLPPDTHEAYEDAIREAGRHVGRVYLERGELAKAWHFYRMLNEPEPVREALAAVDPGPDDDVYPLVELAWQAGLLPEEGVRPRPRPQRHLFGHHDGRQRRPGGEPGPPRVLRNPPGAVAPRAAGRAAPRRPRSPRRGGAGRREPCPQLVAAHPELFGEDSYHIDTSHLSGVVQMSLHLPPGPDLDWPAGCASTAAACRPAFKAAATRRSTRVTSITWRS